MTWKNITIVIGIGVLLSAGGAYLWGIGRGRDLPPEATHSPDAPLVSDGGVRNEIGDIHTPIQSTFENKTVYGIADGRSDEALLRDHCEKSGGTFSLCGSVCSPEAQECAAICAYTCEW